MPSVVIELKVAADGTADGGQDFDPSVIEERLMRHVLKDKTATFDGNEIGEQAYRLFVDCAKPSRMVKLLQKDHRFHGLTGVAVFDDGEEIAFTIDPGMDFLPLTGKEGTTRRIMRPVPGDCFAIPLPDGRWGFAAFALFEWGPGDWLQVLDVTSSEPMTIEQLKGRGPMFPPICTCVEIAARKGKWLRLGHWQGFVLEKPPKTRASTKAIVKGEPDTYDDWVIWQGDEIQRIGYLPEELRSLEFRTVWFHDTIARRIQDGINPYRDYV